MALNYESDTPVNGAINLSEKSGASDDLEDGEIFDDDEPVEVFRGGGVEDFKPSNQIDSPPKEPVLKNKCNAGGPDRKKNNNKDKRSSSNERRDIKRGDRGNNRGNISGGKRKRGRDSEEDHRNPNKPKQRKMNEKGKLNQPLEDEVDENEMIYVMGGNSPTASKPVEWDMFSDEEEGDRDREGERGGGGRGRRGREGFHSSGRMSRRSRLGRGGGKRNRFARKQNNDLTICKFFLQGKCQRIRGNDCPFSHSAMPSKKLELCKFYMSDRCTKKDKCMYMHRDFPCKFYHTGQKCYAGKRCKFYHGKISNFLRSVLMKHLENRELQNEFDKYREQYEKKDKNRGGRDNRFSDRRPPSRSDEEEGGSTPMPSPQREEFNSERERSPTPEREREKRERRRRRKRRSRDDDNSAREYHDDQGRPDEDYYDEHGRQDNDYDCWQEGADNLYNYGNDDNYNDNPDYTQDDYPEEEGQDNAIPANLPKTQRKLFMRIQQHNKKLDDRHREDDQREEDFKEENWYSSDEENAGNNPLNTIFQNVPGLSPMQPPVPLMNTPIQPPMMQPPPPMMNNQCPPMNQPPIPLMANMMSQPQPMVSMPNMFDNIDLSAVTKILTTVRESIQKKSHEPGGMGSGSMDGPGPGMPMDGPGMPMDRPSGPMGGPGGPMGGPGGPMGGPGGPMGGPGGPMGGPGGPMGGPGGPMGGPGGPMGGPGGPMGGPGGPMGGPGGSMGGPNGPMGGPSGSMGGPSGPMGGPKNSPSGQLNSPSGPKPKILESPSSSPQHNPSSHDERRFRDPRLRTQDSGSERKPAISKPTNAPVLLTQADLDLRLSEPPPQQLQTKGSDVDLRRLPFKPAPLHQAANEIDASISSGPTIDYKMASFKHINKPDYATIASRSNPQTCANDPRLRKYATPQVLAQSQMIVAQSMPTGSSRIMSPPQQSHPMSPPQSQSSQPSRTDEMVVSRDPRNRGGVANDPRRRNQPPVPFGASQSFGAVRPPPPPFNQPFCNQPFPDQPSLHQDNDFRLGLLPPQVPQQPSFVIPNLSDIDLRIQQPRYYQ